MPIPRLTGDMTRERIDAAYSAEGYGWSKSLVFDWVQSNPLRGGLQVITYEFRADSMPCTRERACGVNGLNYIQFSPMGVVKTCATCRTTEGPITMELGRPTKRRDVSVNEAWEILAKSGQKTPIGMPKRDIGAALRVI